jgi:hypothetical protein
MELAADERLPRRAIVNTGPVPYVLALLGGLCLIALTLMERGGGETQYGPFLVLGGLSLWMAGVVAWVIDRLSAN